MTILSAWRNFNEVAQMVNMEVDVSLATVAATGWLALPSVMSDLENLNSGVWEWQASDLVYVWSTLDVNGSLFLVNLTTNSLTLYSTAGNGAVTLPVVAGDFTVFDGTLGALKDSGFAPSDATKTIVSMAGSAVVVNHLAKFIDTTGTIDDTAGTAINSGSLQAGLSGTAGTLISFPGTATNGSLIVAAINAGGAFNTTISNSVMGQSTVYSIPDIGAATGGIVVSTAPAKMKFVDAAAAAGGAVTQSFTDAFCTATSVVIGNWVTQTNAAEVVKIAPGVGSFVVTSTADVGVGTFSYVIIK